jgi:hypothetical protein
VFGKKAGGGCTADDAGKGGDSSWWRENDTRLMSLERAGGSTAEEMGDIGGFGGGDSEDKVDEPGDRG